MKKGLTIIGNPIPISHPKISYSYIYLLCKLSVNIDLQIGKS